MTDPIRTFIAADLPETVREELARVQSELGAELEAQRFKLRWVKPENIHLTLAFLGDVAPEMLESISGAVTAAVRGFSHIHLTTRGLGLFPGIKRPRIIWAGMAEEVTGLQELKVSLDRSLLNVSGLTFKSERRPFRAHLTLGRAKGSIDGRKLVAAMNRLQSAPSTRFAINAIHIFKSDLRPTGAVYTKLNSAELG